MLNAAHTKCGCPIIHERPELSRRGALVAVAICQVRFHESTMEACMDWPGANAVKPG